jgi:hypothetical protein
VKNLQDCTAMDDDLPFVIESPTRIKLSPEAKFWAEEHGMTLNEMGKYLLNKERLEENYVAEIF